MITLSAGRVERTLFAIIVVLIALGLVAIFLSDWPIDNFWLAKGRDSFVRLFLISDEGNVPTWYASATLLLAAALASAIAAHPDTSERRPWMLIAVLLAFMSLDESAVIHEMMILPLRHAFDMGGLLFYAWIVPGGIIAAVVALYLLPFARRLAAPVRLRLLAGGSLFVVGALGVEAVTGLIDDFYGRNRLYYVLAVVEEGCEKLGVLLAISAFLCHLRSLSPLAFDLLAEPGGDRARCGSPSFAGSDQSAARSAGAAA